MSTGPEDGVIAAERRLTRQRDDAQHLAQRAVNERAAVRAELDDALRRISVLDGVRRRIAQRHANDGRGACSWCVGYDGQRGGVPFPCPDYRDATGWDRE